MPSMSKPAAGDTDWTTEINDNWTAIQNQLVNAFQGRLQRNSDSILSLQRYAGDVVEVNGANVSLGSSGIEFDKVNDNLITSTGADSGSKTAASTLYYVYVSNASASPFSSDLRLSTTAPSLYNGVKYLGTSGNAANWRFVGWVMTDASNTFQDSDTQRLVCNYWNRVRKRLYTCPAYSNDGAETSYTVAATSFTAVNGGTGSKLEFISNNEDATVYYMTAVVHGSGNWMYVGVGENTTSTAAVCGKSQNLATPWYVTQSATRAVVFAEGYNHINLIAAADVTGVLLIADTIRLGGSTDPACTYLAAEVMV